MKTIFLLLSTVFLFAIQQPALSMQRQQTVTTDSLVWYIYVAGRPDARYMEASKKIAVTWGIHQEYIFGDGSARNNKSKELEKKNQPAYDYLKKNYGEDWKKKFEEEVATLLKH